MKARILTMMVALGVTQGVFANQALPEKSWFNAATVSKFKSVDPMAVGIASSYYFASQSSSGTLDDWGYIDTDSSATVGYARYDGNSTSYLGGEFFLNSFIVSGSYTDVPGTNQHEIGLGYLVQDNLKLTAIRSRQASQNEYSYSAQYQHDLSDGDYLGFTLTLGDTKSLGARYFAKVNGGDHVTVDIIYVNSDFDTDIAALAKYYVGQQFAFGVGVADSDTVLTGNYFFSDEYYLALNYTNDTYTLGFVGQF